METLFGKKQWWRSPPVLVISLIAAAALLFLSGRAAVMAFADGENKITISFNVNGGNGSPPASIRVQPGEYVTLPLQPDGMTKDGYTLVRWSQTTDNSGIMYYPGNEVRFYEDTVLYALWEKNLVISFDLNGGTGTAPAPVICKARDIGSYEEIVMPGKTQDMAKDGYRFIAWDTAPDGSGRTYYPGETYYNISEDTLLYAVWQEVITVSFDANGGTGSVPDPIMDINSVLVDPIPDKPEDLVKPGYAFLYWCTTSDGSGEACTPGNYRRFWESTVLYAIWRKDISLSYNANGGTGTVPEPVSGQPYLNVTIASPDELSKEGAQFMWWNTKPDDSGAYYRPGWSESFGEDTVLYAIWRDTITVSYDLNGGTGTTPPSETGVPDLYIRTPPQPEPREGYQFMNWNTKPDGTGSSYDAERYYTFSEDTLLYAYWYQLPAVTLSYNANGGSGTVPESVTNYLYVSTTVADPPEGMVWDSHEFLWWSTSPEGGGRSYLPGESIDINADTVLYAQWEEIITVSVDFNANGGTGTVPQTITGRSPLEITIPEKPDDLVKDDYEFIFWNTQSDGSGISYRPGEIMEVTESFTLYAKWSKLHHITYHANGGTGSVPEPLTVSDWEEITIAEKPDDLEWEGHVFTFWNTQADGHGKPYSPGDTESVIWDIDLYATWEELITVNYDLNGGEGSLPEPVVGLPWLEVTIAAPKPDMKRDGYVFRCWNSQANGNGKNYDPGDTETYVSSSTLYAMWEAPITVQYSANGGEGSVPEPHVGLSTLHVVIRPKPDDLKKKGCYFYSWNSQESGYGVDYQAGDENDYHSDSTIYAKWKYNIYHVTFDPNKAAVGNATVSPRDDPLTTTYDYTCSEVDPETGKYTVTPPIAELTTNGYHMVGWSTEPDGTEPVTELYFDPYPDSHEVDFTLYAIWEENTYTVSYSPGEGHEGVTVPPSGTYSYTDVISGDVSISTSIPEDEGYRFTGWRTDAWTFFPVEDLQSGTDLTLGLLSFDAERNITAVAEWERIYHTVTYKPGEGSGEIQSDSYEYGSSAAVKDGDIFFSPFGYEFEGWECDKEGYSTTPGDGITVRDDVTYTALWKQILYTLRYDQGSVPSITGSLPEEKNDISLADLRAGAVFISETKPQAEGYTFTGWLITNGDDDSVSKLYKADDFGNMTDAERCVNEALFAGDRTATAIAQWAPNAPVTYTVTYKAGEAGTGEYSNSDVSGNYTLLGISDVGFSAPEGKTFDNWALVTPDDSGYPATANAGDSIDVISNVTYKAQWKSSQTVDPTATISYTSGLTEDFPGYNESCAQPFVITEVPTTVEYPVLGNDPDSQSNPSFAPDGYEFAGWKLVSATGGSSPRPTTVSGGAGADGLYHEGDTVATNDLVSGSVTLKAMWNCKLRYDANEGTGTLPEGGSEITKYVGDSVTAAGGGDLTRDGNAFDHWNTKADDSGTKYPAGQSFVIKDNTVLYAVYASGTGSEEPDENRFTVTYNANGGTGTLPDEKQYSSGETVTVAPKGDLARTGCTFKEWNTRPDGRGTGYKGDGSDSFVITADTTLYAIWVDDNGKIIPSPGTGESGIPMIIAFYAALLSLAAVSIVAVRQRNKREQHD